MTTPLTKLIAENKRHDWHRKLPSIYAADSSPTRLARVTEVLLAGLQNILAIAECHGAGVFSDPAAEAIQQATAIAEGKDKTDEAHNV